MKKLSYLLLGAAGLILASCSQEDLVAPGSDLSGFSNVTLSLEVPQLQTRAYADGQNDNLLQYAVYDITDSSNKFMVLDGNQSIQGNTNVVLKLANSHKYQVVMWASINDTENTEITSPYTVEFTNTEAKVNIDYSNILANSDNSDAFYAAQEIVPDKKDQTITVQLRRPLAQINIGTNDYEKFESLTHSEVSNPSIKVDRAYQTLDLFTGNVSNETENEVTFTANNVPSRIKGEPTYEEYPKTGYHYLAMAYVLVGEKETFKVTYSFKEGNNEYSNEVNEVPLQRNYKTNIYGSLLTYDQNLKVEIVPDEDGKHEFNLTWDGSSVTYPEEINTGVYSISQPSDLAGLVDLVNESENGLADKTYVLTNDFDMNGNSLMIGSASRSGSAAAGKSFKGIFDGNGKTISNLKIVNSNSNKDEVIGFIPSLDGNDAVVKDIYFDNVIIDGGSSQNVGIIGMITNGATVSNVKVEGGKISGDAGVGGIAGRMTYSGTIENCVNKAEIVSTGKGDNTGGIVGTAYYTKDANTVMNIKNCDNYGNVTGKGAGIGGIVGLSTANITGCNNYGVTVKGGTTSTGGIVGEQKANGSVIGCTNNAEIIGGTGYGSGGIVGWVRYTTESAYPYQTPIVVEGNTNNGKHITGAAGVGGIVGMWYSDGLCKENTNFAEKITASGSFVAGIVGGTQWTEVCSNGTKNYDEMKLTVTGNTTYTTDENINGSSKNSVIYDNTMGAHTIIENNITPDQISNVSSVEDLTKALEDGNKVITLGQGNYDFSSIYNTGNGYFQGFDKSITLIGYGAVIQDYPSLRFNKNIYSPIEKEGATIKGITFDKSASANVKAVDFNGNFYDCNFTGGFNSESRGFNVYVENSKFICDPSTTRMAFHDGKIEVGAQVILKNCEIDGRCDFGLYGGDLIFDNCTFKVKGKEWGIYGNSGTVTFQNNCKIDEGSKDLIKDNSNGAVKIKGLDSL